MTNAGTIVGYITQPNGSPISGAKIWICETAKIENKAKNTSVRSDSRGYFQLPIVSGEADVNQIFGIGGELKVSIGRRNELRENAGHRFQVTGYLISETLEPEA